jgi:hypothetical protein
MKMFSPMNERGPGGRRYISKRNIFIRPKN